MIAAIANIVTAVFAFIAAALWLQSTRAKAPVVDDVSFIISEDGFDVLETAKLQTSWNRYAALAAAVSAISQGIAAISN